MKRKQKQLIDNQKAINANSLYQQVSGSRHPFIQKYTRQMIEDVLTISLNLNLILVKMYSELISYILRRH